MKNTKIFFGLLVLAAAVLAFGCNQANNTSDLEYADASQTFEKNLLKNWEDAAKDMPLDYDTYVKPTIDSANSGFAQNGLNFYIADNGPDKGKDIPKGSNLDYLKGRFKLEKK